MRLCRAKTTLSAMSRVCDLCRGEDLPEEKQWCRILSILERHSEILLNHGHAIENQERMIAKMAGTLKGSISQMRQVALELTLIMRRCKVFDCPESEPPASAGP